VFKKKEGGFILSEILVNNDEQFEERMIVTFVIDTCNTKPDT